MSSLDKELGFDDFCSYMWRENCQERSDWQEKILDKDVYIANNLPFLKRLFQEEKDLWCELATG
jgi:hypothetical protein